MIVAAYQGPVAFGDAAANLQATLEALSRAEAAGASILCMPETFLHGYFPTEEQARPHAVSLAGDEFARVLEAVKGFSPTLLIGLIEIRGEKLYNTAVVIERGRLVGRYAKHHLVYRYFTPGEDEPVFERDGLRFGIIICADSSSADVARREAAQGAAVIFSLHFNFIAYDGVADHTWRVRCHHQARAVENRVVLVRANVVVPESQGAPVFGRAGVGVGDSFIVNPHGRMVAEAGLFRHTLLFYDLETHRTGEQTRVVRDDSALRLRGDLQSSRTQRTHAPEHRVRRSEPAAATLGGTSDTARNHRPANRR